MRSNLDGSEVTTVIAEDLYEPTSIAVDPINGKLYWIDDGEGIHYKLEESNLDGSERLVLVQDKHQQPIDLAVDKHSIYWTDFVYNAVWKFNKLAKPGVEPTNLRSYFDPDKPDNIRNILVREDLGSALDCKAVKPHAQRAQLVPAIPFRPTARTFGNLTITSNGVERCLNGGQLKSNGESCRCKPG
jgi:hypothetical protein